jgi:hypothetical protein
VLSFENDWINNKSPFDREFSGVERLVQRAYDEGQPDRFFKGIWYTHFIHEDVRRLARQRQWHSVGFHDRVICCLAMTIKGESPWARELCSRVDELMQTGLKAA